MSDYVWAMSPVEVGAQDSHVLQRLSLLVWRAERSPCVQHLGHTETLPTGMEILLSVPESVPMGSILTPLEERKNIHGERVEPSLYLKFIWARSFSPSQRKLDSGTKRGNHSSKGGASPALCLNTET